MVSTHVLCLLLLSWNLLLLMRLRDLNIISPSLGPPTNLAMTDALDVVWDSFPVSIRTLTIFFSFLSGHFALSRMIFASLEAHRFRSAKTFPCLDNQMR